MDSDYIDYIGSIFIYTYSPDKYLKVKEKYEKIKKIFFDRGELIDYIQETDPWPEKVRKLKSTYHFTIYQNINKRK